MMQIRTKATREIRSEPSKVLNEAMVNVKKDRLAPTARTVNSLLSKQVIRYHRKKNVPMHPKTLDFEVGRITKNKGSEIE